MFYKLKFVCFYKDMRYAIFYHIIKKLIPICSMIDISVKYYLYSVQLVLA